MLMLQVHAPNLSSTALVFQEKKKKQRSITRRWSFAVNSSHEGSFSKLQAPVKWEVQPPHEWQGFEPCRSAYTQTFFSNKYSQPLLSAGFPFLDSNIHWSKTVLLHSQPQIPNHRSKTLFWSVVGWIHKYEGPSVESTTWVSDLNPHLL